jgi:transcription termination factor Rho
MKLLELESAPLSTLRDIARGFEIPNAARLKKENLLIRIRQVEAEKEGLEVRGGVLEIMSEGVGFLRTNYQVGQEDVYVSQAQLRRYDLRSGDLVIGHVRPPRESERHYGLLKVESINGIAPEEMRTRLNFENLTPIFPEKRYDLESDRSVLSTRLINLIAPIGRGQRGMIVSPPKAGKTTILDRRTPRGSDRHRPLGRRRSGCLDLRRAGFLARAHG